jgi:hypothetical protein
MPRANSGNELFKYLNTVTKFTIESGGASTLSAEAVTVDQADTDVVSHTGFAAADFAFIDGSGGVELMEITSAAANNIVWKWPLQLAQNSGATVVEAIGVSLNHIAESGVTFGGTQSVTPIRAATSRVAIAYFASSAEFSFSIPCLGHNNLNLLASFGAPETEQGVGSSSDPYAAIVSAANVNTESTTCFRLTGALEDGKIVVTDILDATIEVNVNATVGAANPEGFTIAGKCTAIAQRIYS